MGSNASAQLEKGSPIGFLAGVRTKKTVVPLVAGFIRPADILIGPTLHSVSNPRANSRMCVNKGV